MNGEKPAKPKFYAKLSHDKKSSVDKFARDSLAIEVLGELAVYSAALPYQSFVAVTLSKIMSLIGAATGSVFQYAPETKTASIVLWQGLEAEDIEGFSKQSVAQDVPGLAANCILNRAPILVKEPPRDKRLATPHFKKIIEKYNLSSAIALPIIKEARVYGAMVLFSSGDNHFDEDDVIFLRAVSLPIVAAFEAHRHVAEINGERANLWNIMENLSIGILLLDENGIIKNCNKTAVKMMRVEEGMLIDKPVETAVFTRLLSASNERPYSRISEIAYDIAEEITYVPPAYKTKTAEAPSTWNAKFVKLDSGGVFIFSDICKDRKFFASQAALAEAAVKFVKRPIMELMDSLGLVGVSGTLNSRQYENLVNAQKICERLWNNLRLVEKSVEYAAGRHKPLRETLNLAGILGRAEMRNADAANAKGVKIETSVTGDGIFYGDFLMVSETIDVVLREIIESAPAVSHLRIAAKIDGERLNVVIFSDNPDKTKVANPAAIQYLRTFFDYIKGEIDFNPAAEGKLRPVVAFAIPAV